MNWGRWSTWRYMFGLTLGDELLAFERARASAEAAGLQAVACGDGVTRWFDSEGRPYEWRTDTQAWHPA